MVVIDRNIEIACIQPQGLLQVLDFHELTEELIAHPHFHPGMDLIWDLRKADMSHFNSAKLMNLSFFLTPHIEKLPKRHAIVVGRELEYGIMRMWDAIAEQELVQERKLFWDMDESRDWLLSNRREAA